MHERCLNEAERILASDKDVIVPVKKIWEAVGKQGRAQGFEIPALPDFTALLEGDTRFEFLASLDENGEPIEDLPRDGTDQEEELESLGFYSGDRVKLRSVELTPEVIGGLIRQKVDRTMDALARAWERRPEKDSDTEDQLLDILAKTQKLQREVKNTFSDERMKELGQLLKKTERRNGTPKKTTGSPTKKVPDAKKKATAPKKKLQPSKKRPKVKKPSSTPRSKKSGRS
ncbi:MAG: hypothetical protein NTZ35_05840 [Ignavibacteriales bacterium]|nr:hypothetical protein [Ignavibacteriales bacterium]